MSESRHEEQKRPLSGSSTVGRESGRHETVALVRFHALPPWYQENEYIQGGYRPVSGSVFECFRSWTYIHNETFNIFSHLIPALITLLALLEADRLFMAYYPLVSPRDREVLAFYLMCVIMCFGLSAIYHTLINHSASYSHIWSNIDYCGIMALIFGDFITGEYVGFYCEPHLQTTYWILISIFTGLTAYIVLNPKYQTPAHRLLRLFSFTSLGLSAFAPIVHALILFDANDLARRSGLNYYFLEGAIVFIAVLVYAYRLPEKARPGAFDIWGASHQIFHVLTVVATIVQFRGIWTAYDVNYYSTRC